MAKYSADGIDWIIDDASAQKALQTMVRNVSDFRPYWPKIEDAIRADETQRFVSADGGSWKSPNTKYAAWKSKHGGVAPESPLIFKGYLRTAATVEGMQYVSRGPNVMIWRIKDPVLNLNRVQKIGRVINANSPYLRKAMGDAAGLIALEWKAQWDRGGA